MSWSHREIKVERTQIHLSSDVFMAVAVVVS